MRYQAEGEHATIVLHSAVVAMMMGWATLETAEFGTHKTTARRYQVTERDDKMTVRIGWVEPKKRNWEFVTVQPREADMRYYTIERDGQVVYDSRDDVPLDMDKFDAERERWRQKWRANAAQRQQAIQKATAYQSHEE